MNPEALLLLLTPNMAGVNTESFPSVVPAGQATQGVGLES